MLLENYSHADRNYTDAYIPVYSKPKWGLNADGMADDKMTPQRSQASAAMRTHCHLLHQRLNLRFSVEALENTKVVASDATWISTWGLQTYQIGVGSYS